MFFRGTWFYATFQLSRNILPSRYTQLDRWLPSGGRRKHSPLQEQLGFHETDQSWKSRVADLLRRARVVILIPGASQALNWETMTAFRELKPQQLVILGVGTDTPRQYKALARMFKESTGRRLPHPRRLGLAYKTGITFDEGWVPRILRLGAPRWRSVCARLHNGLEPVFRANGIKWYQLPLSMKEVTALPCTAVLGTIQAYESHPSFRFRWCRTARHYIGRCWPVVLAAMASEDRLKSSGNPHTSAASDCRTIAIYEYTA